MKLPRWVILIPIGFCVVSFGGVIFGCLSFHDVADFALILTFIVIFFYTYFTYILAKEPMLPVASFWLEVYPNNVFEFHFIMKNYCKLPLTCWCNLNASINGKPVSYGGFYSGESPFYIQPFGIGSGHFSVIEILEKGGCSPGQLEAEASFKENPKGQLYLNIDFWYGRTGMEKYTHSPPQPYYFDFTNNVMVTDF
jgi:hypothetical protein